MAKTPSETKSAAAQGAAENTTAQPVIVMAKPVTKTEEPVKKTTSVMQIKRVVF